MTRAVFVLGLLTTSALAEPRHLPPGTNAVRILDGQARLIIDGKAEPELTLLPEGVFFNVAGYEGLEQATLKLQDDLTALRASAVACAPAVAPLSPPTLGDWSARDVLLAGAVGVVVGVVGGAVLVGLRAH